MGLLMSDTMLIDPLLDETMWSRVAVGAWAHALDATYGGDEQGTADLSDWPHLPFQSVAWGTDADP